MPRTPYTFCASYLLLLKDGKILLARRFNTGFEDGKYSLPAGHTETGETFTDTIIRESKEEIGITLQEKDLRVSHVLHRLSDQSGREYVDVFFIAANWASEPVNMEADKCDELSWFPVSSLPENIVAYVRQAIENSLNNIPYSEFGWK